MHKAKTSKRHFDSLKKRQYYVRNSQKALNKST